MRVAYLARSVVPSRNANGVHVMKACQGYARLGHRVTLWLPRWREGAEPGVIDLHGYYGVERSFAVRRVPLPPRGRLQAAGLALGLPLLAFTGRPALVHARSLSAAWGAACLLRLPTLLELHAPPPEGGRPARWFGELAASPHLLGIAAITRALAAVVAPRLPETARLVVAPDGVDARWISEAPERGDARATLGLAGETRRIAVYTGHLYQGRGIELILAMARLRPDHLFVLVGGRADDVESWRHRAAAAGNVHFAGFRPPAEIPTWLAAADVLLMPYAESIATAGGGDTAAWASPMKMFEYLAAGRPVLASTLPVLGEVLTDGVNALRIPAGDPRPWAEALGRLAERPALAAALAERARRDAAGYTWEDRARRLLAACGWASETPSPAAVAVPERGR